MSDWWPKNRGKVRGWKRHLRQVEALRERYREPDTRMLETYGYDVLELHLAPWGNLVKRNPPPWLRRRFLDVFLDVHRSWTHTLAGRDEPTDVMLWLCHPRFWRSQVVAAVGDRVAFYRGTFYEPRGDVPPRPPALYHDPAYNLDALDWTPGIDCDWTMGSDFEEDPIWREMFERRFRRQVVEETVVSSGDTVIAYRRGMAWIGRLR